MPPARLAPGTTDALLFDLGRVVLDIDFSKAIACWAAHSGRKPSDLVARFVRDDIYRQHEIGRIDDAAYFDSLRASLGIGISDDQFLEGWNDFCRRDAGHRAAAGASSTPSPTPTGRMSSISPAPMPTCSAISVKSICLRQSGFGNRTRRPMIMW
jgi:hypothetical protein